MFVVAAVVSTTYVAAASFDMAAQQSDQRVAFTKKVDVFGVPIYATNTTGDDKLLHAGFWYSYDDTTCDYDCMASEYIYWAFTSFLGAQDIPGRFEQVGHEWKLTTRALLQERDPAVYAILSNPEYNFPSVAPDGKYTGRTLRIEPYEHR